MYERRLYDTTFKTAVLENKYLRATFMPAYGGKLWSLIDKTTGQELFMSNPVVRPCNLAIRNAWTSGGVEWNCGFLGHHPHTCSQIYTARTATDDGTPVLRMYEYERVRRVVYQMDFFLPDGSKLLYARMRIVNDRPYVTPIYWWSNIAVPEKKGARVIAPVTETFTHIDGSVAKAPVPFYLNTDITYPVNQGHSIDFFWKIPDSKRKYICQLDESGYGLIQTSTARLKGRKLFVWGQGPGGDRWQEYLTADGSAGRYAEIQAGLAHTQYESLPMPPRAAWEWLEGYGAMQADAAAVHGDWEGSKTEVEARLDAIATAESMEAMLKETHKMAVSPAAETILFGSGYGALENYRRVRSGENVMCPHLNFGAVYSEQEQWKTLLETGSFGNVCPDAVPPSWMLDDEWFAAMEKAVRGCDEYNWYAWLQYGMTLLALNRPAEAKTALDRSFLLTPSAWALYGLACLARLENQNEKAANLTLQAAMMKLDDASLAKEAVRMLSSVGKYTQAAAFIESLPGAIAAIPRIRLSLAFAYMKCGRIEESEALLYSGGGIVVADIREGEVSITDLWFSLEELKAKRDGREFDRDKMKPPAIFDFRMNAEK
jgi:tetratricopeptide (TPR) repeat protein